MRRNHALAASVLAFAALLTAGCVSTGTFNAYKAEVEGHREASQEWATKIAMTVERLVTCHKVPANCDPPDQGTQPPPNGKW